MRFAARRWFGHANGCARPFFTHQRVRQMMDAAPYALFADPMRKPQAFTGLDALARWLLARREGKPLQFTPHTWWLEGEHEGRCVVAVATLDEQGLQDRQLGYAWLSGQGADRLIAALHEIEPPATLTDWAA